MEIQKKNFGFIQNKTVIFAVAPKNDTSSNPYVFIYMYKISHDRLYLGAFFSIFLIFVSIFQLKIQK